MIMTEPSERLCDHFTTEFLNAAVNLRKHYNFRASKEKVLQNESVEQQQVNSHPLNISPRVILSQCVTIKKSQNRKVGNARCKSSIRLFTGNLRLKAFIFTGDDRQRSGNISAARGTSADETRMNGFQNNDRKFVSERDRRKYACVSAACV